MTDYYKILEMSHDASIKEIRRAYKKMHWNVTNSLFEKKNLGLNEHQVCKS